MSLFGPSKEEQNLASQLQAVSSKLAQAQIETKKAQSENKEARENWASWARMAKEFEVSAEENKKRAEFFEQESNRLQSIIADLAKGSNGWHNFGGDTWFWLDSIVGFKTKDMPKDPQDHNSPDDIFVSEISDKPITGGNVPRLKAEVLLAILEARKKSRRGGGGGGGSGDLPNAPMPVIKPEPTPGLGR